tara:strand:- start:38399 stop:38557 length:159 start_codon:yes stop_codon:yes gene_type:complete
MVADGLQVRGLTTVFAQSFAPLVACFGIIGEKHVASLTFGNFPLIQAAFPAP